MGTEPFRGNLSVRYPQGPGPTTVISVAIEDGVLEELMRNAFTGDLVNEAVFKLEVGQVVQDTPDMLRAVKAAAGMAHTLHVVGAAGVTGRAFTANGRESEQGG